MNTHTMDRRTFLAWLSAAAAPGWLLRRAMAADADAPARPSIVMVLSDDHTKTDTGCYGSKAVKTPHIDRLAAEGMRFDNAFTATAMCVPSRATLYTGLYPMRHGAWPNHSRVYDKTRSLPHHLKPLGCRVAVAGKTHFSPRERFPFEVLCSPQDVTNLRLDAVEKFLAGLDGKPFCLFVCTTDPHVPWPEQTPYDAARVDMPPYLVDTPATRKWMARYYAEIFRADRLVGAVDAMLKKHRLADNTLLIYSSDHGGQWPYAKWNLYDASINVPFVARWPGKTRPGSVSKAMVHFVDVVPTCVELAGGKPVDGLDGKSFADVLRGRAAEHHEAIFATSSRDGNMNDYPMRAIRTKTHKYILNLAPDREYSTHITKSPKLNRAGLEYWPEWLARAKQDVPARKLVAGYLHRPAEELYDLRADPFERNNLAADAKWQELRRSLRRRLEAWMKRQGDDGLTTEAKADERRPARTRRKRSPRGGSTSQAPKPAPPSRTWRYTLKDPGNGWEQVGYDDAKWKRGRSGFGRIRISAARVATEWSTPDIWLRRVLELKARPRRATLRIFHDEDAEVYLNGRRVAAFTGHSTRYFDAPLDAAAVKLLKPGPNVLAVHCRQTLGGQYIDAAVLVE